MKASIKTVVIWLLLNIAIVIFMDLALFMQTTPANEGFQLLEKVRGVRGVGDNRMDVYYSCQSNW